MKKRQNIRKITPMGMSQSYPAESAKAGEAAIAVNVRECDNALVVTGAPKQIATIPTGHQLLVVDDDRMVTLHGRQVMLGQDTLVTLEDDVVGAHRVGSLLVIVTAGGLVWLRRTADGYRQVTLADACPDITLSALEWDTASAGMEAVTFESPYAQWPTTLATGDVTRLTTLLRRAWSELQQDSDAAGTYAGMLQVRCGVRLHDDTYLWLSDPITLGQDVMQDANPVTAEATLDGTQVTGVSGTTLTRHRYRVGITVNRGVADEWMLLVKCIDILATRCIAPVNASGTAQYRTIGIGGSVRRPQLEFGLPSVSQETILSQLAQSGWHVIASTTDLSSLNQRQWVSDAVASTSQVVSQGITSYVVTRAIEDTDRLTSGEAQDIKQSAQPLRPVASTTCNGRLMCVDAEGMLSVSAIGNPLANARQQTVTGATVRAIMPLSRAIYSNGFGRYPIALFTDEGIYALPQSAAGAAYGEPRLLDRTVIAAGCRPIEGDRDLYFISHRGHLCRLRGSEVDVVWPDTGLCQLAWDDAHRELWALSDSGTVIVLMSGGHAGTRTVEAAQLYNDTSHALAVNTTGTVLDLTQEQDTLTQAIDWQSHPMASERPGEVVWQVMGKGSLTLQVTGERGISCHGFTVGSLRVRGTINAPLRQRLLSPPLRTLRLRATGQAASGTILLPIMLS